ncbi:eukaryotic integral membrane protein-domain-containing protein [Dimargaris cristalligena]|uniref:Eukaryotic integral membrane protein-domain-containing protein n=1 Tax=Dimargaris cristalligena TaxID=215637 RepID=A0A4P9ZUW9_9FUNG|nr:eukaryotic integral membrane protein-domain-containing protein [Dimargaris cristalligena]|eukprot:RKP36612.1 eukaryotic integral membrane protein-domain-containing protein [Dimargaris cristalligena]
MLASLLPYLRNIPPVSRICLGTYLCLSALVSISRLVGSPTTPTTNAPSPDRPFATDSFESYIILYPGLFLTRPWTLFLTSWVDTNLILILERLIVMTFVGTYLEKRWGWLEFVKFIFIVNIASTATAFLVYVMIYAGSQSIAYLYATRIHGLICLMSGFTVALKESIPEHKVSIYHRALSFRVKYLTLAYLAIVFILALLLRSYPPLTLAVAGVYASWLYLRFYKDHNGTQGDYSDAFAFATFFPDPVQPPVALVSDWVFRFFVAIKLVKPLPAYNPYALESAISPQPSEPILGMESMNDSERRK